MSSENPQITKAEGKHHTSPSTPTILVVIPGTGIPQILTTINTGVNVLVARERVLADLDDPQERARHVTYGAPFTVVTHGEMEQAIDDIVFAVKLARKRAVSLQPVKPTPGSTPVEGNHEPE